MLGGLIRAWGAAYLRAEVVQDSRVRSERLVADGPFRYSRNPLYLGLLIGVFGAGPLFSRTGWVVQMSLALVFCYRLIRREEAELYLVQGDKFVTYYHKHLPLGSSRGCPCAFGAEAGEVYKEKRPPGSGLSLNLCD